ncbi:MAG: hypothetical protein LBT27_02160 [Prevotellaceae bacterium]|jgi:hypothetical protein|nr:hypothetical protein [Prevotellaceae bacterium]
MSKILIVSKTKISDNYVCVGGIDLDKSLSVRLLNEAGRHELKRDCPYNIRDIWNIEYCKNQTRPLPHSEDVCVTFRSKMRELKPDSEMIDILKFQKYPVNHGNIRNVFEGKLKDDDVVSFYISKEKFHHAALVFGFAIKNWKGIIEKRYVIITQTEQNIG